MAAPKAPKDVDCFTGNCLTCHRLGLPFSFGVLSLVLLFAVVSSQDASGECQDISGVQTKLTTCENRIEELSNSLKQSLGAEARLAESTTDFELLKEDFSKLEDMFGKTSDSLLAQNALTQQLEQDLVVCKRGDHCEAPADTNSEMETLQKDHFSLIQSRLQLATELESSKSSLAAAEGANRDLESKIAVLTPKVNDLVACKESKAALKSNLESLKTDIGAQKSDLETQKTSCQSKLKSSVDKNSKISQLLAKHEETNAELSSKLAAQEEYLFSFNQLRVTVWRYRVVVSSAVQYGVKEAYARLVQYVPHRWQSVLREAWQQKVVMTWEMKIIPLYRNSVRSHEAWKMTARLYNKNLHPHLVRLFDEAKDATLRGFVVIREIAAKYTEVANQFLSDFAVAPFVQQYPQAAPFIPSAPLDRVCFLGFLFAATRLALAVCCCPVWLLLGLMCCILRTVFPCCHRGRPSASHLKKSKRHRKPFQPAAIATSNVQRPMKDQHSTGSTTNTPPLGVGGVGGKGGDKDSRRGVAPKK